MMIFDTASKRWRKVMMMMMRRRRRIYIV